MTLLKSKEGKTQSESDKMGSSSKGSKKKSSKGAAPPPLDMSLARGATSPVVTTASPRSPDYYQRTNSEQFGTSGSVSSGASGSVSSGIAFSPPPHSRKSSNSSITSSRKPSSPTTNVYTTCGRHTDQFLFGGRSLSDFWKKKEKEDAGRM